MSKIDELIAEFCPEGVPVSQLGDVAEVQRGISISRSDVTEGPVPVLAGGQQPSCWHNESNRGGENVVVAGSGAYAGFVSHWMGPIWVSDSFSISGRSNFLLTKFCFYMLKNRQDELHHMKRGSGVPHVYAKDFAKLFIPVPPIEVQREIVSILDKFTQLEAELAAELEARKSQYEHTREQLLNFSGDLSGHPMSGLIAELCPDGVALKAISKYTLPGGNVDWSKTNESLQYIDLSAVDRASGSIGETQTITAATAPSRAQRLIEAGDVIFATTRPAQMRLALIPPLSRGHVASTGFCILRVDAARLLPSFLAHYLKTPPFQMYVKANQIEGNYPSIPDSRVRSFEIPVPPLEVQREIVSILDKLDALVNDLTFGLPAEIAARRKQYEYYRNKLLTFKELDAA